MYTIKEFKSYIQKFNVLKKSDENRKQAGSDTYEGLEMQGIGDEKIISLGDESDLFDFLTVKLRGPRVGF